MGEYIGREATDYWQHRAVQAENVLDNLIQLLGYNFPHMQPDLGTLIDTWNKLILEVEDRYPPPNSCKKCGGKMNPSQATGQTFTGIGDFHDNDEPVTLSPGGPGKLINCLKCEDCGWSTTQ